jgi:hypothetical protein
MKNLGIFFFIFSLIFLFLLVPKIGSDIQTYKILDVDYNTDKAKLFPYLIGVTIFVISILIIIQDLRKKVKIQASNSSQINSQKVKDVGILLVISLIYIILFEPLGFFIMTPVCLVIFSWFFGLRKWFGLIVVPILITISVYLCFEILMKVQLPKGILEWMFF